MKITNFWGDLTDISAKKAPVVLSTSWQFFQNFDRTTAGLSRVSSAPNGSILRRCILRIYLQTELSKTLANRIRFSTRSHDLQKTYITQEQCLCWVILFSRQHEIRVDALSSLEFYCLFIKNNYFLRWPNRCFGYNKQDCLRCSPNVS